MNVREYMCNQQSTRTELFLMSIILCLSVVVIGFGLLISVALDSTDDITQADILSNLIYAIPGLVAFGMVSGAVFYFICVYALSDDK